MSGKGKGSKVATKSTSEQASESAGLSAKSASSGNGHRCDQCSVDFDTEKALGMHMRMSKVHKQ